MKFTQAMQDAINEQVNREMWSAHLYLSMSAHFANEGLKGFSSWFYKQYKEEIAHAEDMMKYILTRGGKVEVRAVEAVPTTFESTLAIVEQVYEHECYVSSCIEDLVRVASKEQDMASQDFFWKYIREQVEEEETASDLVQRVRMAQDKYLYQLDKELGERQ
jgi:ferritin